MDRSAVDGFQERAGTRREIELLLCCAQAPAEPAVSQLIRGLLAGPIDWGFVQELAVFHRLGPLLYRRLAESAADLVPPGQLENFGLRYQDELNKSVARLEELSRLFDLFRAHDIPAVSAGGPALAVAVYGEAALRIPGGINLWIRKQDFRRARDLLLPLGYRPKAKITQAPDPLLLKNEHCYVLEHPKKELLVELQWAIAPRYLIALRAPSGFMSGLEPGSRAAGSSSTPRPEDLLLILSAAGTVLLWEQLLLTCDIAQLVHKFPRMNWKQALETACRWRIKRMVFVGLLLAKDLLRAVVPEEVIAAAQTDPEAQRLARDVSERVRSNRVIEPGWKARSQFLFRVQERPLDKMRCSVRFALAPSERDLQFVKLPPSLSFLYFFLRPLRLFQRYRRGISTRVPADLGPHRATPHDMVERMLAFAEVGPEDVVYDLGCGDGRIVIAAARQRGAKGVGVDVDPYLLAQARATAHKKRVEHLVRFLEQDAKAADLTEATVVMLWVLEAATLRLRQKLRTELRQGARVVSRHCDMGDWSPVRHEVISSATGVSDTFYLWRID